MIAGFGAGVNVEEMVSGEWCIVNGKKRRNEKD
jgi:hypothetical protein